jgi:hypothetical protein
VKTTNIDLFLHCDEMTIEDLIKAQREEKALEEEDPQWDDVFADIPPPVPNVAEVYKPDCKETWS